ncbi:hypothetical protein [Streptomyces sp. WELS2]|uniref:hypothetical protein n=1 Tax=Streptomyces sp. WELS2 TaxID=2749435 RepID=UPI0015F052CB|nr:hypothetical protein [Streptomyces sp. WELS2]
MSRVVAAAANAAAFRFHEERFVLSVGVLEGAACLIGRPPRWKSRPTASARASRGCSCPRTLGSRTRGGPCALRVRNSGDALTLDHAGSAAG